MPINRTMAPSAPWAETSGMRRTNSSPPQLSLSQGLQRLPQEPGQPPQKLPLARGEDPVPLFQDHIAPQPAPRFQLKDRAGRHLPGQAPPGNLQSGKAAPGGQQFQLPAPSA